MFPWISPSTFWGWKEKMVRKIEDAAHESRLTKFQGIKTANYSNIFLSIMNSVPMCGGSNVCLQTLTAPPAQDKEYISPGGLAGHAQCPAVSPSDLVQNKIRDITVITESEQGRPAWRPVCPGWLRWAGTGIQAIHARPDLTLPAQCYHPNHQHHLQPRAS